LHKYEEVLGWLSQLVSDSPAGTRIPTEKELAAKFHVSTMTVRRALQILIEAGRLNGIPGRGTFVARPRVLKQMNASSSFSEAMRASGRMPSSRLLEASLRPATEEEAVRLSLDAGSMVYVIRRVRLGDQIPLGYEVATLNADALPGLLAQDLQGSLYEIIGSKYGLELVRTEMVVSARLPNAEVARHLEIHQQVPCLETHVTSRIQDGELIEHTLSLFRGDMYEVAV
jgi:GntR family transcriptional regulator